MENIKPQENQSIFDMALQEYGSIEGLFDLLQDNGFNQVDKKLSVYDDLIISSPPTRREIKEYYFSRKIHPATEATQADLDLLKKDDEDCVGVGCMEIGDDFEVCPSNGEEVEERRIKGEIQVGNNINVVSIRNSLYYRVAGSNDRGTRIDFLTSDGEVAANIFPFAIDVVLDTDYEVYVSTSASGSPLPIIGVALSIAIDKEKPSVFNSTVVIERASELNIFGIKLFPTIIQ